MKIFTVKEFIWKSYKTLHNRKVYIKNLVGYEEYCSKYVSYRHMKKNEGFINDARNVDAYFSARPNPGAGIGHQMANWIAGLRFAELFHLKHAHIPFSSQTKPFVANEWDRFLGFGEKEITVKELVGKGYRPVLLPLFNENNAEELEIIKKIIASYKGKVVFIAEQDQFYKNQYEAIDQIQERFYQSSSRINDNLIFLKDHFNIVIHARRGDIGRKKSQDNPNLSMRFQELSYFTNVLDALLENIHTDKIIDIYLISQGRREDYKEFDKYENIHYCLDMNEISSFCHMVYADALITSKSSFSYKPALLNRNGVKICPYEFWHGYPKHKDWILADNNGTILEGNDLL